jgi:RimJ/RimL family protein N-acetyltransferase
MSWLQPVTLRGQSAILEPLRIEHAGHLADAARDGELWKLWYTSIPAPERMAAEIERRLALQLGGTMLPFAIVNPSSGKAVGMTTYLNVEAAHRRLEIGATWYRKSVQRTAVNTECKLMLLRHAFEQLGCIAVEFRTNFFNHQSRRAIERLGAKLDGVLRNHRRMDNGTLRDTCVYSIVESEWPTVKAHLQFQLQRPRGRGEQASDV